MNQAVQAIGFEIDFLILIKPLQKSEALKAGFLACNRLFCCVTA
jgi:hypothetical protein